MENYNSDYSIRLATLEVMGGDMTKKYDSTYSIDLEILRLMQEGGGIGGGIKEVEVLPDASENSNKFVRLLSDENVYMAKYSGTTYTNRLPDDEQINKAYLWFEDDEPYYYKGVWKLILNDGEINGYGWLETYPDSEDWYLRFAQDNAVNTRTEETKYFDISYDKVIDFDLENHTLTIDADVAAYNWEDGGIFESNVVLATYNAPEATQIGNAYIKDEDNSIRCIYTGELVEITPEGYEEPISVYKWYNEDEDFNIYTTKKASDIYFSGDVYDGYQTDFSTYTTFDSSIVLTYSLSDLHIAQINASEAEQIGNAYIKGLDGYGHEEIHYYNGVGVRKTIILEDASVVVYLWGTETDTFEFPNWIPTTLPANEIYSNEQKVFVSNLDMYGWEKIGDTLVTVDELTLAEFEENCLHKISPDYNVSTVKYQRKNKIYEWKKLVTED